MILEAVSTAIPRRGDLYVIMLIRREVRQVVRVRVYPQRDGTSTIHLKKTRSYEKPSRTITDVKPDEFAAVLQAAIIDMRQGHVSDPDDPLSAPP